MIDPVCLLPIGFVRVGFVRGGRTDPDDDHWAQSPATEPAWVAEIMARYRT